MSDQSGNTLGNTLDPQLGAYPAPIAPWIEEAFLERFVTRRDGDVDKVVLDSARSF